jgi:hypothetical protein
VPVFVYGSLLWKSVQQVLLGRVPKAQPALLTGFRRWRVKGERFPAVAEEDPSDVASAARDQPPPLRGALLMDLTPEEAAIYDEYEDDEYDKRLITPSIVPDVAGDPLEWAQRMSVVEEDIPRLKQNGLQPTSAWAYIWTERELLDHELWRPSRDFIPYEDEYLQMTGEFVEEDLPEELKTVSLSAGGGLSVLKLSGRQGVASHVAAAAELLKGSAGKAPANRLCLKALGGAVPLVAQTAAELEKQSLAKIQRVSTGYPRSDSQASGNGGVPQLAVYLVKQAA